MQTEVQKVKKPRGIKFWLKIIGVFFAIGIIYSIGEGTASEEVSGEKVNYEELVSMVNDKEKELTDIENKLAEIETQYNERESEFNEALKVVENKKAVEDEIKAMNGKLDDKKKEISSLDETITARSNELASIEGDILAKAGEPKTLPSGTFIVGMDIPANRYVATPNGDSGNFVVYSPSGDLIVNQILGSYGVSEHVFFATDGDIIEISMPTKFTPVQ